MNLNDLQVGLSVVFDRIERDPTGVQRIVEKRGAVRSWDSHSGQTRVCCSVGDPIRESVRAYYLSLSDLRLMPSDPAKSGGRLAPVLENFEAVARSLSESAGLQMYAARRRVARDRPDLYRAERESFRRSGPRTIAHSKA